MHTLHGTLLIATPRLNETYFSNTVIYLCKHDDVNGTLGLIINKAFHRLSLADLLQANNHEDAAPFDPNLLEKAMHVPLLLGGPIEQTRLLLLTQTEIMRSLKSDHNAMSPQYSVTNDTATMRAQDSSSELMPIGALHDFLKHTQLETPLNIFLGYTGWKPGQLETEFQHDLWWNVPSSTQLLYQCAPAERYHVALKELGVNSERLAQYMGEA